MGVQDRVQRGQQPASDGRDHLNGLGSPPSGRRLSLRRMVPVALLASLAIYGAISSYIVLTLTRTERWPIERTPDQYGLEFETVTFPSRVDALPLEGWLLAADPEAPLRRPVVVVHGKGGHRQRVLEGDILEISAALVRQGHPVLLFDLRGAGRSAGDRFTLGAEEVRDVGGAIDYLSSRGLAPEGVDLLGYSMGAATSMLVAAADNRVRALAVDSGYADLEDVLGEQVPKASGLPSFFTPGIIFMARPLLGVDAYDIRPINAVPALAGQGVRLLVIHGEADDLIPFDHGRRLVAAYGSGAESYFVPGAGHVASYEVNPRAYLERITGFFGRGE